MPALNDALRHFVAQAARMETRPVIGLDWSPVPGRARPHLGDTLFADDAVRQWVATLIVTRPSSQQTVVRLAFPQSRATGSPPVDTAARVVRTVTALVTEAGNPIWRIGLSRDALEQIFGRVAAAEPFTDVRLVQPSHSLPVRALDTVRAAAGRVAGALHGAGPGAGARR